jgi:chromosome segregation ATPase
MPRKLIETKDDPRKQIGVEAPVKQIADSRLRTLLFHFHIFKNGGSTIDAALKKNFGNRWRAIEGPDPDDAMNWPLAIQLLTLHPELEAFSSHTARIPAPEAEDFQFIPLFLLRHPIDRIASIHNFERRRPTQGVNQAMVVAQTGTFADFVTHALTENNSVACDVQTSLLSRAGVYYFPPDLSDLVKAKAIVATALVPGVVEEMEHYLVMLEDKLSPQWPSLDLASADENRNAERRPTLLARLREIRSLLPTHLWNQLRERNRLDLELWRFTHRLARERFLLMPEAAKRLADFRRRKMNAHRSNELPSTDEPLIASPQGDLIAEHAHRYALALESAIEGDALDAASIAGHLDYTRQLISRVKSLEQERDNQRKRIAQLSDDFAERTTWALSLDAELQQTRSAFTEQSQLVEERTAWAQSLDQELQSARANFTRLSTDFSERTAWANALDAELRQARSALTKQSQLVEERTAWAQSLEKELQSGRANFTRLSTDFAERTAWSYSLDTELQQARSALTKQSQLVEERTAWAQSLDQELQSARAAHAAQTALVEARSVWGQSLERELRTSQSNFTKLSGDLAERTTWALSLDAELQHARSALTKQSQLVEERTAWAQSLEKELQSGRANFTRLSTDFAERTAWANSLDTELQQARSALTKQSQLVEERTAWAQSLDQELQSARAHFTQLSADLADRTAWAKSLDTELQQARSALTEQTRLIEERIAPAQSLEQELQSAPSALPTDQKQQP